MNRSPVAIILGAELRAWRNRLVKSNAGRTALLGLFVLVGGFVVGGAVFGVAAAASQLLPYARDPMLVGAFTALSILMLVVGFPTVIANFFVGTDLLQLVLAPVRPLEIFLARSVLAMRANLLLGFVIATFVIGVGAGANAPVFYFAVALLLVALQVLTVTAVQTVLMCVILRWVPARLARDVSVAVASVAGAAIYLAWQLTLRQTIGRRPDVSGLVSFAQRIDWLPAAWPGHALSATLAGSPAVAAGWLALTVALAVLLVAAAGYLYGRTVVIGIGQLGGAGARWKRRTAKPQRLPSARTVSPEAAIARKDWITYRRDVRRLARLLPAVIFLIGYAVVFNRPQRHIGSFWNDAFLVAFVSMFLSMAVATSAVPSERRGFQLLRMAPIKMSQLLRAKILYSMLPVIAVSVTISAAIAVVGATSVEQVVELTALALWLSVGFVTIGVCTGAIDPRFEANDDRRMVGTAGSLAGLGAELGFGGVSVLAFAAAHVAVQVYFGTPVIAGVSFDPPIAFAFMGGAGLLVGVAVAVIALFLRTAASRLASFEAGITSA